MRYSEARFLALRLRAPRRVAVLAAPGRGALRALARRSGVHALLLRNPATPSRFDMRDLETRSLTWIPGRGS